MGFDLISSTIVWIFAIGSISFVFRKRIAGMIKRIPLPKFLLFFAAGIAYSIIEENINCPPTGCMPLPPTIPIFFAFLITLFVITKLFKIRSVYKAALIFGIIGWIAEFLLGSYKEVLWSSPAVTAIMSIWTILTYAVIVIVPLTILFGNERSQYRGESKKAA